MRLINILIDLKIYIFWRENLGNITAVVWVYYAEFLALLPGMASFISSASPDHTKLCPVPAVKLLGLCWEIDPGPSLFTLLQPEMLTDCAEVSSVISWSYTANLLRWQLEFRENFGPPYLLLAALLQTHALLRSLIDISGSVFCSYFDSSFLFLVSFYSSDTQDWYSFSFINGSVHRNNVHVTESGTSYVVLGELIYIVSYRTLNV